MKTHKTVFLALVPHEDVRAALNDYSVSLFKAGFTSAFRFPCAAPLAVISQPFSKDELKSCARSLRNLLNRNSATEGKITVAEISAVSFPAAEGSSVIFGPRLDFEITPAVFGSDTDGSVKKVTSIFSQPVIGVCLQPKTEIAFSEIPPSPKLSFRAAAVANIHWQSLSADGYKWEIEKLIWLPRQ